MMRATLVRIVLFVVAIPLPALVQGMLVSSVISPISYETITYCP